MSTIVDVLRIYTIMIYVIFKVFKILKIAVGGLISSNGFLRVISYPTSHKDACTFLYNLPIVALLV